MTKAPAIICEPFFIDNNEDYENALEKFEELAEAYVVSIHEALSILDI